MGEARIVLLFARVFDYAGDFVVELAALGLALARVNQTEVFAFLFCFG